MSGAESMSWAATRFDGRSAAGETVLARIDDGSLVVVARGGTERFPLHDVDVAETFEHAPRMLALPGGATLEIPDPGRTFRSALLDAGVRDSWIVRMQRAWAAAAVAVLVIVALAVWGYARGIPVAARWIAQALPASVEARLGANVLEVLDEHRLAPSKLPRADRERITKRFYEAAARAAPGVDVRLEFRAGPVNAFALPGGTIVLFDELVALAGSDERVLGVLGHELGHVAGRHSTRQLLQALGVGAIASLLWGDLSALAANAPLVLGVMRYGREFEEEADRFSLHFMRANGLSARPLWEMFTRLQGRNRERRGDVPEFLSTHPDTSSRIQWLRAEMEADEAKKR
jgi:predicted Zn-dependent protease